MHVLGGNQLLIIIFTLWFSLFLYCSIEDIRYKSIHSRDLIILLALSISFKWLCDLAPPSILPMSIMGGGCDLFGCMSYFCKLFHGVWLFNVVAIAGSFFLIKYGLDKLFNQIVIGAADIWIIISMMMVLGVSMTISAVKLSILIAGGLSFLGLISGWLSRQSAIPMIPFFFISTVIRYMEWLNVG